MNETGRDRRLDAAWRIASREQPPAALDDAIRAAARRAVAAGPGRRSNKHWWYPLAAAATVAVLAVGIAQLTPPEQVAPIVGAESSLAPREVRQDADLGSAVLEAKPAVPPVVAPVKAPAPAAKWLPKSAMAPVARSANERPRSAAGDGNEEVKAAKPALSPPEELPRAVPEAAAANTAASASTVTPAPAAAARSEPFPAAPEAQARRDAYPEQGTLAERAPAGAAVEPRQLQSRMATAQVAPAAAAKAKPALGVAEWIRRIRELKNAGRTDEAAKELAAFRAAYGERADALLPADLQPSKR